MRLQSLYALACTRADGHCRGAWIGVHRCACTVVSAPAWKVRNQLLEAPGRKETSLLEAVDGAGAEWDTRAHARRQQSKPAPLVAVGELCMPVTRIGVRRRKKCSRRPVEVSKIGVVLTAQQKSQEPFFCRPPIRADSWRNRQETRSIGHVTVMRVPAPGPVTIRKSPPEACARRNMPLTPPE